MIWVAQDEMEHHGHYYSDRQQDEERDQAHADHGFQPPSTGASDLEAPFHQP
jgi:hypothetical protein